MNSPVVVAVTQSPHLQETLSVLLEHDCRLRFVAPESIISATQPRPDVAIISTPLATRMLDALLAIRPHVPVVAIGASNAAPALEAAYAQVCRVPLRPEDIRAAVRQRLPAATDDGVDRAVEDVVRSVRAALAYPLQVWRALPPRRPVQAAAAAVLSAILQEQSAVIEEICDQLAGFAARPRGVVASHSFASDLCAALPRLAGERCRALQCEAITTDRGPAGPAALVPLLAALLIAYLQRRQAANVIDVRVSAESLCFDYEVRRTAPTAAATLPVHLASLALQASGWRLHLRAGAEREQLRLAPSVAGEIIGDA